MFPINGGFCISMIFYPHQSNMVSNLPILYPNMSIFPLNQNTILTSHDQPSTTNTNELNDRQLYIPVINQEKQTSLRSKKIRRKKIQKFVDSAEQVERLRRKLANRPKTYKTQKKMYLKIDLTNLGIQDKGKRVLRKRVQQKRKKKNLEQSSSKFEIQQKQEEVLWIQKTEEKQDEQKIVKELNQFQQSLNFSGSKAEIQSIV